MPQHDVNNTLTPRIYVILAPPPPPAPPPPAVVGYSYLNSLLLIRLQATSFPHPPFLLHLLHLSLSLISLFYI